MTSIVPRMQRQSIAAKARASTIVGEVVHRGRRREREEEEKWGGKRATRPYAPHDYYRLILCREWN